MRTLVTIGQRKFVVLFADDGSPRAIKERKDRGTGRLRDHTYWHRTHPRGRGDTIVNRVLAAAEPPRRRHRQPRDERTI